ncbi:MAG: GNAT family N-acetyltransferase [Legionella sp.]|nr:GNAT family N-acetyltransferase [Legionella sp.]
MLWSSLNTTAQSILLNFQGLIFECVQQTNPDKHYYAEKQGEDFHYLTQILFPLMNGIISFDSDPQLIDTKCELLKNQFKETNYPLTWFWPHDMDLPQPVESIFAKQGFYPLGKYASVAVEAEKVRNLSIKPNEETRISLVETENQFEAFMQITSEVYGMPSDSLSAMRRLYSAYRSSDKIKLYLAEMNSKPVATILGFHDTNTLGLYNGATFEAYRKQGLLTDLMIHAVKDAPATNYVVAQLMAAQNARGVCDKLGFKEYAHFIPLCHGFDLNAISA